MFSGWFCAPVFPSRPSLEGAGHRILSRHCVALRRALLFRGRRGGLTPAGRRYARWWAREIWCVMHAHPLNDDLRRLIVKVEDQAWPRLEQSEDRMARYKNV